MEVSQLVPLFTILYSVVAHHTPHASAHVNVTVELPVIHADPFGVIVVDGAELSCVLLVLALHALMLSKLSLLLTK